MDNLWAPWRMTFIAPKTPQPKECIFCTQPAAHEDENLMIAPYQHVGSITQLDAATLDELMAQAQLALRAIRKAMNPDGFNMGINEGKVAGAGFDEHMHFHIVPRWQGDTNFMPVIADIKVMPEHLDNVYRQLKEALNSLTTHD